MNFNFATKNYIFFGKRLPNFLVLKKGEFIVFGHPV